MALNITSGTNLTIPCSSNIVFTQPVNTSTVKVDRIVMKDGKDGVEFEITIYDGKINIEPVEKSEKRNFRINKILDDGNQ